MSVTADSFISDQVGHRFSDADLLVRALTHRSAAMGKTSASGGNERLEFLGDRVLGLVIANLLYGRFPKEREGALAKRFVALVRKEALAEVAEEIGLGPHIRLSKGEADSGGRVNPAILADTLEALIAALYLDGGLPVAETFITRYWEKRLDQINTPPQDAKTRLQEWLQARGRPLPVYQTLSMSGPAHAPIFTLSVSVDGQDSVSAEAKSKRDAAQAAAEAMLRKLTA